MKCYTLKQPGVLAAGIATTDGKVNVGAKLADGSPLLVPVDPRARLEGGLLMEVPGRGAMLLVCDHAGRFGSWHLRANQPDERWDGMLAAGAIPNALDRILACERVRARYPHRAPVGWYEFARGSEAQPITPNERLMVSLYGYMEEGAAFELRRRGNLEGTPSVFLVQCRNGNVTVSDPLALAVARRNASLRRPDGEPR